MNQSKILFTLSWIIASLITITSCVSLFMLNTYSKETKNWLVQSIGQDMINLFLVTPFLVLTSIMAYKGNKIGMLFWAGAIFYLIYTYLIYCFDIHFNRLFLIYCLILGLSFYSFIYFLLIQVKKPIINKVANATVIRMTGLYLIAVACLFYLLWLSVITSAIMNNTVPEDLVENGLATNPVHVIDLSVCLPGLFIVGILVLRRKTLGFVLAPSMLIFCILMNITIGGMVLFMKMNGLTHDISIPITMGTIALFTCALLFFYLKNIENKSSKDIPITKMN